MFVFRKNKVRVSFVVFMALLFCAPPLKCAKMFDGKDKLAQDVNVSPKSRIETIKSDCFRSIIAPYIGLDTVRTRLQESYDRQYPFFFTMLTNIECTADQFQQFSYADFPIVIPATPSLLKQMGGLEATIDGRKEGIKKCLFSRWEFSQQTSLIISHVTTVDQSYYFLKNKNLISVKRQALTSLDLTDRELGEIQDQKTWDGLFQALNLEE